MLKNLAQFKQKKGFVSPSKVLTFTDTNRKKPIHDQFNTALCFHTSEHMTHIGEDWGHMTTMRSFQNESLCWRLTNYTKHKALFIHSSSADQGESSHVQSRNLATPIQHLNKNEPVTVHWRSPQVSIASKSLVEEAVQDPAEGSVSKRDRSNSGSGTCQNWKELNGERSSSVCIT